MDIKDYKELVHSTLEGYFTVEIEKANYDKTIWEAMRYTTLLGGKRLRAIFCLEACRVFSGSYEQALPCACAIEMLHAQSLIHDDLPCMDNDDLRRGKPSNHKVFGEAMAVLAGDALISFGAQTIIEKTPAFVDTKVLLEVVNLYLKSAGAFGIVAGQCADIEAEKNIERVDYEHLEYIHTYKTAALFECAILSGAMLGGANKMQLDLMKEFSYNFGLAFQAYDDILDVISTTCELGKTAGKDEKENKATFVTLFGLDYAKEKFSELILNCHDILKRAGVDSKIFLQIIDEMCERVK